MDRNVYTSDKKREKEGENEREWEGEWMQVKLILLSIIKNFVENYRNVFIQTLELIIYLCGDNYLWWQ